MTHRALITQMLKSLEWFVDHEMTVGQRYTNEGQQVLDNITAARAYLAAPEQSEPVAWCELSIGGKSIAYFDGKPIIMTGKVGNDCHTTPLYTHPAPKAEPVVEDLAMMVRRLVLSIRRLAEDDSKDLTFANTCLDWLKHKGLAGSPLRDTHPSQEAKQTVNQMLLEALKGLCFELPNVLPSSAVSRLEETGKTIEMPQYDARGHTGTIQYRADDMQSVYAAYDAARAAITAAEQAPQPTSLTSLLKHKDVQAALLAAQGAKK